MAGREKIGVKTWSRTPSGIWRGRGARGSTYAFGPLTFLRIRMAAPLSWKSLQGIRSVRSLFPMSKRAIRTLNCVKPLLQKALRVIESLALSKFANAPRQQRRRKNKHQNAVLRPHFLDPTTLGIRQTLLR